MTQPYRTLARKGLTTAMGVADLCQSYIRDAADAVSDDCLAACEPIQAEVRAARTHINSALEHLCSALEALQTALKRLEQTDVGGEMTAAQKGVVADYLTRYHHLSAEAALEAVEDIGELLTETAGATAGTSPPSKS